MNDIWLSRFTNLTRMRMVRQFISLFNQTDIRLPFFLNAVTSQIPHIMSKSVDDDFQDTENLLRLKTLLELEKMLWYNQLKSIERGCFYAT